MLNFFVIFSNPFLFCSEFLIDHFDHIGDGLVLVGLYKPFSEITLDRYVELLFLVGGEARLLNLLLNFSKALQSPI